MQNGSQVTSQMLGQLFRQAIQEKKIVDKYKAEGFKDEFILDMVRRDLESDEFL